MNTLSDKNLDELLLFTGTIFSDTPQTEIQNWRDAYRKVEKETNKQIEEAGSITAWYESGRGRLI